MLGTLALSPNETKLECLARQRSERQFYLDKEPDSYWINVYAFRRNGAIDTSSVFETEADAAADAKRPSPEYQYLYTLWISKTGNPQVRDVLGVTLIEGEGLDK